MKNIRCVIIDDEPIAIDYLKEYVVQMPQLELIATFNRAKEAFGLIESQEVDLLLIDIQMPEITGLDFIRTLRVKPNIIITTAYSEYAVEGFNLNVLDYLLKPISFERFALAIHKVENQIETPKSNQIAQKDFMFLKSGYKSVKVNISDITHIEGMKEYIVFHSLDNKKYMKNERMKNVESELIDRGFIRVHKSFLVSINHITSFYGNTIEINDKEIPVGRSYKEGLKDLIDG
jgi:DNA-binding LytR/AlgR family response regulator